MRRLWYYIRVALFGHLLNPLWLSRLERRRVRGRAIRKAALACGIAMPILSAPCALGFNLLQNFHPLGGQSAVLDLEDFLVSDLSLPIGALAFVLYCTCRRGWGWDSFLAEANAGQGLKLPAWTRRWFAWGIPIAIVVVLLTGLYARFER